MSNKASPISARWNPCPHTLWALAIWAGGSQCLGERGLVGMEKGHAWPNWIDRISISATETSYLSSLQARQQKAGWESFHVPDIF